MLGEKVNNLRQKKLPSSALTVAFADLVIIFLAGYAASIFRFGPDFSFSNLYILLITATVSLYFSVAIFSGVYQTWRGLTLVAALSRYSYAFAVTVAIILGALVFSKSAEIISRLWLASSMLTIYLAGVSFRIIYFYIIKKLRRDGYNVEGVFVAYTKGIDTSKFDDASVIDTGYDISMRYQLDSDESSYAFLIQAVQKTNSNELWLFVSMDNADLIRDVMYALRFEPINIRLIPDFGDQFLLNAKPRAIGKTIALDLSCNPLEGKDAALKRFFDIAVSLGVLLFMLPIMVVITIAIKLTSKGPITFKQQRNGLYGDKFWVYKFRSMKVHNETDNQITQAQKGDLRITKVGAFLRKTSLDELPQFFNVLLGDMSIVGPRPHALAHNEYYKDQVEAYMWRNKVKPGITGWAQVNGFRGETDTVDKMAKRIEYDLWYMENWSLILDIKIFLKTFISGFTDKNAY
jgi:putative colanic acid biosynthesis UDP-glucose lipid carrier transferase